MRPEHAGRPLRLFSILLLFACGADEDPFAVATDETAPPELATHFELPAGGLGREAIHTVAAGPATLARTLDLPARVQFDEDHRAHVTARLAGVVAEVHALLGERVQRGQLLAVVHSPELARTRSSYIEASHLASFARSAYARESKLWERGITAEEDYLRARHALEEATLELRTTEQELLALGVGVEGLVPKETSSDAPEALASEEPADVSLNRFECRAPIDGVVVGKSVVLGEAVESDSQLYEVADLAHVWIDVRVRASELESLHEGSSVEVVSTELRTSVPARIAYVDARVDAATQTALARIVLPNPERAWRPGLFVTVRARVGRRDCAVAVPSEAVQRIAGSTAGRTIDRVFVAHGGDAWEAREVQLGFESAEAVEVLSGLSPGEQVAVRGGLLLKASWLGLGGLDE